MYVQVLEQENRVAEAKSNGWGIRVVSLSCLDELNIAVGTGVLFQATGQEIEPSPRVDLHNMRCGAGRISFR
jgi:hypothetical protein